MRQGSARKSDEVLDSGRPDVLKLKFLYFTSILYFEIFLILSLFWDSVPFIFQNLLDLHQKKIIDLDRVLILKYLRKL